MNSDSVSALYTGSVMHQRLRPRRHRLRYRVFSLLVDLDELPALSRRLRLFSLNRFNLFSLHERDYGDGRGLREHIDCKLREAGMSEGGPVSLLTMPRILGYAFNPLSVYFCHRPDGALLAILYEVNNTFGERHSYLLPIAPEDAGNERITQTCAKALHVSPFLGLQMHYEFRVKVPCEARPDLDIGISATDADGTVLVARLDAKREPLRDTALARIFLSHPLLTLKVIAAIHWEALRLWLKGIPLHTHPGAPRSSAPLVKPEDA
ncbi:DUF1365 domain-containing protein [Variovorax rhizosphaerae]|uniref:DUF1365 domain-containing protein n=1 Tax=Variovorax rhizosphaerae TaxID=1836200 RepID=A0ABU8WXI1_9BURK